MRLSILAVGRIKERGLRELVDDYVSRIRRHVALEVRELRESRQVEHQLRDAIPPRAIVVALCASGLMLTSEELAARIAKWGESGNGVLVFLIGGPDGLPPTVEQDAHIRLSLSRLTLAHRIARVVLLEQLYRVTTIWRGEPFHR